MNDQQHPITPPPELRAKWITEARSQDYCSITEQVADRAAQWGAYQRGKVNEAKLQQARDQELEACCEWLDYNCPSVGSHHLRNDRRPKPLSAVEQAEELIDIHEDGWCPNPSEWNIILEGLAEGRRALEVLSND